MTTALSTSVQGDGAAVMMYFSRLPRSSSRAMMPLDTKCLARGESQVVMTIPTPGPAVVATVARVPQTDSKSVQSRSAAMITAESAPRST